MQPLAIVYYERLMPGSQLVNKLQDISYRVLTLNKPDLLAPSACREMPMIVFTELGANDEVLAAIEKIKADSTTNHIPVVVFAPDNRPALLDAAQKTGVSLAVSDSVLLNHLPQLIEQALQVE
jgi:DNA-binding NarL/FixJ family response regulator